LSTPDGLFANKSRILLFGGSFDPPTRAHSIIAMLAATALDADLTLWIPNQVSPWKDQSLVSPAAARIALAEAAILGINDMEVWTIEAERPGPSYTFETVLEARRLAGPAAKLWFLCGADVLSGIASFREAEVLCETVRIAAFDRPGFQSVGEVLPILPRVWQDITDTINTPKPIDISSTAVRDALLSGGDVSGLLLPAVFDQIVARGLYGSGPKEQKVV
jgi:nicotinate-nucleotide adenylyltransferase